jgi:trehalose 6-phosphate phosphatase
MWSGVMSPCAGTRGWIFGKDARVEFSNRHGDDDGDARNIALFLDLLQELFVRLDGAMAIVSGRDIAAIDALLAPLRPRAAGAHGSEMRDDAGGEVQKLAPGLSPPFVEAVRDLAKLDPGIVVEIKDAAVAVHYREAPDCAAEVGRRLALALPLADGPMDLRPGRMVVEVMDSNISKGAALHSFMQRPPFSGRRPIMIGDDVADLTAFAAAETFGGKGLRVAGEFFDAAGADFDGTAAVRQWLHKLADRISAVD